MKVLTKNLLSLANLCSVGSSHIIAGLYVSNEKIVATDSYNLVEVDISGKEYADVVISEQDKITTITHLEKPLIIQAKDILDLLKFCKWKKGHSWCDMFYLQNLTEHTVEIFNPFLGITKRCYLIAGEFPKYEQLLERKEKKERSLGFNMKFLSKIADCIPTLDPRSIRLHQTTEGDNPHLRPVHIITNKPNYKAIFMPLR